MTGKCLNSGLLMIVMALAAAVVAQQGQAFELSPNGAGGRCENGSFVTAPNGVGIVGCSACINGGGPTDPGIGDCRNCCMQLTQSVPGDPANDYCRIANGCR